MMSFLSQNINEQKLEDMLARWVGRKYALVFNTGTSALRSALYGLALKEKTLIGVQAYNYPPVVHVIASLNFTPMLLDVNVHDLCIDYKEVERAIESGIKALVITHMWGWLGSDIEEIYELCKKTNIIVIEDASRAYGAMHKNRCAGRWSDIAIFSMQESKVLSVGEGGFMVTDDLNVKEKTAYLGLPLRSNLSIVKLGMELGLGENYTIHPAAVKRAIKLLPKLDERIESSRYGFNKIENYLSELGQGELIKSSGLRGGWSHIAIHNIKNPQKLRDIGIKVNNEFETNNITTWCPESWKMGKKEFPGAQSIERIFIAPSICKYTI